MCACMLCIEGGREVITYLECQQSNDRFQVYRIDHVTIKASNQTGLSVTCVCH